MTDDLSPRQHELLAFIVEEHLAKRPCPSFREMCAKLGVTSTNTVCGIVEPLVRKGMLARVGAHTATRSLVPTPLGLRSVGALEGEAYLLAVIADLTARVVALEQRLDRLTAVEEG
jgi:SOS-response transcriptional repressor LexA